MKDTYAREQIECLARLVRLLERRHGTLEVHDCPKCKHDTVQVAHDYWGSGEVVGGSIAIHNFECLVCGSHIMCKRAEKCVIVDKEPQFTKAMKGGK